MMDFVVERADAEHVPRSRLVVAHADLGRVEWPGTCELAERQARCYGLEFVAVSRPQGDLLQHVEQRDMFPSPAARYCTANHKRAQLDKVLTMLGRRSWAAGVRRPRLLSCMGLRAQESPSRARRSAFYLDGRASTGRRHVDVWLPIHSWSLEQVWQRIRASGVPYHR